MTSDEIARNFSASSGGNAPRYDRVTIALHWLTAVFVIALFASAYWFNALPHGNATRTALQALHVSIGIAFALVFLARLVWRFSGKRRLPPANRGLADWLARGMHGLLYFLLAAQVALGFLLRWAQGEEFYFFNLFAIPPAFAPNKSLEHLFEPLHNDNAWLIIYLAAAHAIAALVHHYVLKDGVLKRMRPAGT